MIRQQFSHAAFGLLLLVLPVGAYAQGGGFSQSHVPMLGSGQMPTAVPGDDLRPTNLFQMTILAGARFDDNVLLGSTVKHSDIGYSFAPSLAFTQTRRRLEWGLSYGP